MSGTSLIAECMIYAMMFFGGLSEAEEAQAVLLPEDRIAAAVCPLPEEMRDGATVMGLDEHRELAVLREGRNGMICLADDPADDHFHVACYHESLEPFMERGRELRAEGLDRAELQEVRRREIEGGTLQFPDHPAALYSFTGPPGSFDPETRTVTGARLLHVIYVPYATVEQTGITGTPGPVWLMNPGEPWAHIMISVDSGMAEH